MTCKYKIIFVMSILSTYLFFNVVLSAVTFHSIFIQNDVNQSTVTICCRHIPTYVIFPLHHPERIVIDFLKISKIYTQHHAFPINFNNHNLIKCVRTGRSANSRNIRIVCDLNYLFDIQTIFQKKIGNDYHIILIISRKSVIRSNDEIYKSVYDTIYKKESIIATNNKIKNYRNRIVITTPYESQNCVFYKKKYPIVVAIDAGHGGQDPGAINYFGVCEKNINLGIARKLKKLLNFDSNFKAVMIRDDDRFLSVTERSDLARKNRADILISIHADSSLNSKVRGASIWILSNQRAKIETIHWLKRKEKCIELLRGLGHVLSNYRDDPCFSHLILDLQFNYSQQIGYNIAVQVLHQLKDIGFLHKNTPECSGFGVLRSPDIPSILIETGFISNLQEVSLLVTDRYQKKIAQAIYQGVQSYFLLHQKNLFGHI